MLRNTTLLVALAIFTAAFANAQQPAPTLAATPPMGWNSWDAYAFTIDESQFHANAGVLAGIRQFGWQYAVIDEGWYFENPLEHKAELQRYDMDAYGRMVPVTSRFPSADGGNGFKPLADWTHAQGLKFGIHIIRGIPRKAVEQNLPIVGSSFHAIDAGDTTDVCPWDGTTYGLHNNAAGQAYYDSIIALYAGWGVDFLKVDCIADHTYKGDEIKMIAAAIKKTGRPIVLSLSPGPAAVEHADVITTSAQMWRITNDMWDNWRQPQSDTWVPMGVYNGFDALAKWQPYAKPGNWPDSDMLPWGSLRPHPGWGDPRQSRLTHDEQKTQFTLWAIARSPLILGANLTELDDYTVSLITNKDVIAIDQHTAASHPVTNLPKGWENARVWMAEAAADPGAPRFIAIFNLDDKPATLTANWKQLGLRLKPLTMRDLYGGKTENAPETLTVTLPPHGSALYRIQLATPRMGDANKEDCSFWCN